MTLSQSQATTLESRVLVDNATERTKYVGALEVVHEWHDVTHDGVFRFCDQQPCHAVNSLTRP